MKRRVIPDVVRLPALSASEILTASAVKLLFDNSKVTMAAEGVPMDGVDMNGPGTGGIRRISRHFLPRRYCRWIIAGVTFTLLFVTPFQLNAAQVELAQTQLTQPVATSEPIGGGLAELKGLSLQELMNVEVTSVSKRESTIGESPAAIFVITQDDIRRSGATSIPEALRMAPGLEVAQVNSSTWAISSRGFNSTTANKLLVMIDGRSVYTPLYSGVFWDVQDTMMQDVNRIEVIRGPAGALWGANAVNGVINVITRTAKDTQGLEIVGGGGSYERAFGGIRYGWKMSDDVYARVYVKHFERGDTELFNGASARDEWRMTQTGFRIDAQPSSDDHYTFHGDLYSGSEDNVSTASNNNLFGGNLVGLWSHDLHEGGDLTLQMYYDRTDRELPQAFAEGRDTFDIDFQHHFHWGTRQNVTWGLGYRVTSDRVNNSQFIRFVPDHRALELASAFVQDEIDLVENRLRLTVGSKFEHNDFSGFEVEPNARLLWNIDKRQVAWGAISRAVRTPARLDEDLQIPLIFDPTTHRFETFRGNSNFKSEEVLAYEIGYRVEPLDWLALDVAAFYNVYDHLESVDIGSPFQASTPPPPHAVFPLVIGNKLRGDTYGVEVGSTWKPANWWTIRAAYTYLQVKLRRDPGSTDTTSVAAAGNDPDNQVYLRSSMDFPHHIQLDVSARYVDPLPHVNVPSYTAVDARVAWQPTDQLELAVVGQNLLDNRHPEFGSSPTARPNQIPRGVYGMLTYRW
jgi:iron complex outermembrane receptor protein